MSFSVGFFMDQIAGHVTNYHNLRAVAKSEPEMDARWYEISYRKPGGSIERLRDEYLPFMPSYISGVTRGALEMYRALRHAESDVIFTNASVRIFFFRTFRAIPTLIDLDATPLQLDRMEAYSTGWRDPRPLAALKWQLFKRTLDAAARVQAWSHWAKQSLIDDYDVPGEKIIVTPPGVCLNFWQPNTTMRPNDKVLRVLFVGADFRRKGGNLLLEWFRQRQQPNCELHVVTREPVASGNGIFVYTDMKPNSQRLLALYQQSDLFVLPSIGECFGIATIEAMAAGLPVIASDVGGTADIIQAGHNGYIVPGNDGAALIAAIERILGDEQRRIAMGRHSRALAEERFDVQKNARRTFGVLQELSNKRLPVSI
ncbi:hypothetical protein SE17_11875 [Kouleothrix aurantiaca]|jgi:glycosyltransferase involved in cell wall biosynthesis|uniref:Glycosyl transferase family 1 domain-containing protein n=1 Tax=Kouleothrix aurantiaca TaxID=186479 RepID=A0A0N8PSL4_9CHLR|nr:hypothetical protein SE17_11875 [Kouleothrix aurantiaca]